MFFLLLRFIPEIYTDINRSLTIKGREHGNKPTLQRELHPYPRGIVPSSLEKWWVQHLSNKERKKYSLLEPEETFSVVVEDVPLLLA